MNQEYAGRVEVVGRLLAERGLDALIVTGLPNIRYLTGFTGSNALALVAAAREAVLFTDPRYEIQAAREVACPVVVAKAKLARALMNLARRKRFRRLGFEAGRLTFADYESLRELLWPGASLEPVAGLLESQRMVKSPAEIGAIRGSMHIAARAWARALPSARPGVREFELAAEIDYQMRRLGAERPAFDTIVLSGERSALPHARPGADVLAADRLLLVDVGAVQAGYASDMTRMAFLGAPGTSVKRLYQAVVQAQQAALDAIRPGASGEAVDRAARRVLRACGLERAFVHSTGHGLGLEIHELPRLGKGEKTRLVAGMVVTVEPGVYIEGFGGIRVEDTVVVTSNGCEILTPASKELLGL